MHLDQKSHPRLPAPGHRPLRRRRGASHRLVIFLHPGGFQTRLVLDFRYIACALKQIPARDHLHSTNLVARLNLPNMAYAPADKLEIYARAVGGLFELEPHPERRLKYLDFIDIYAHLDDNERQLYAQRYPHEASTMTGFAQRFIEEGRKEGREEGIKEGEQAGLKQGLQRGEARVLTALLRLRFGDLPVAVQQRIEAADADTLLRWSERVLTAQTLEEVLAAT